MSPSIPHSPPPRMQSHRENGSLHGMTPEKRKNGNIVRKIASENTIKKMNSGFCLLLMKCQSA